MFSHFDLVFSRNNIALNVSNDNLWTDICAVTRQSVIYVHVMNTSNCAADNTTSMTKYSTTLMSTCSLRLHR